MPDIRQAISWLHKNILSISAVICLLCSIVMGLMGNVGAGALFAGLFIILYLFEKIPEMEQFKAYGVEAKWRQRLSEADEIIEKLRKATMASARLGYHTLGWGRRMGDPPHRQLQAMADLIDNSLTELGSKSEDVAKLHTEYLAFAAFDLLTGLVEIIDRRWENTINNLNRERDEASRTADAEKMMKEIDDRKSGLQIERRVFDEQKRAIKFDQMIITGFRERVIGLISDRLPSSDITALRDFADRIATLVERMQSEGRIGDEACSLLDMRVSSRDEFYAQVFVAET